MQTHITPQPNNMQPPQQLPHITNNNINNINIGLDLTTMNHLISTNNNTNVHATLHSNNSNRSNHISSNDNNQNYMTSGEKDTENNGNVYYTSNTTTSHTVERSQVYSQQFQYQHNSGNHPVNLQNAQTKL